MEKEHLKQGDMMKAEEQIMREGIIQILEDQT